MTDEKTCNNCKISKKIDEFHKRKHRLYGFCKACKSIKDRESRFRRIHNIVIESLVTDLSNEIWMDIKDYENLYQVSNMGRVKSLGDPLRKNQAKSPKILKPALNKFGFHYVTFYKNKEKKKLLVFQLVARHFIKDVNNFRCFKHKNGNKLDNRVENIIYDNRNEKLDIGIKVCKQCRIEKNICNFYTKKNRIGDNCIVCELKNKKEYYNLNKKMIAEKDKKYRIKNKERINKRHKEYVQKNKKEIYRKDRERKKQREKTDINYKLRRRYKTVLYNGFKNQGLLKNGRSCKDFLGCLFGEFKSYIESKFEPWMNWENYGVKGWHFGHIVCCELFDLTKDNQVKLCFHYKNLKPQYWLENITSQDFLPDGRRARDLSPQEKTEYLQSIGINLN